MNNNFQAPQYQAQQQNFSMKNARMNEAISNKVKKQVGSHQPMRQEAEMKVVREECMDVEESEIKQEKKGGFFSNLFGSKEKKAEPPKPANKAPMKKEVERKASYDSDEDEMEIKNYMMGKN